MSIILGIDPGSLVTGFGAVKMHPQQPQFVRCGVLKLKDGPLEQRLVQLGEGMQQVLTNINPQVCVIEEIFLGKNVDSAFKLGHARGVIMYECAKRNIPVISYATRQVKKGITGKGSASKEEVQFMLEKILKVELTGPLDASDALALALHHAYFLQVEGRWAKAKEI